MLPGSALLEALGFIAAMLTTFSFLPQALRIRRQRSAADVSLAMYLMMLSGQMLWLAYGVAIVSPSLIAANIIGISLVGWVLAMKFQDIKRQRPVALHRPAAAE